MNGRFDRSGDPSIYLRPFVDKTESLRAIFFTIFPPSGPFTNDLYTRSSKPEASFASLFSRKLAVDSRDEEERGTYLFVVKYRSKGSAVLGL